MLMLSSSTPSPVRIRAPSGSPAIPPHTPTHVPTGAAAWTTRWIKRKTAGCSPSTCAPRLGCRRSIASVYCARSLVPIEKKSTSAANSSAISAADGTSTIMPISTGAAPTSCRTADVRHYLDAVPVEQQRGLVACFVLGVAATLQRLLGLLGRCQVGLAGVQVQRSRRAVQNADAPVGLLEQGRATADDGGNAQ